MENMLFESLGVLVAARGDDGGGWLFLIGAGLLVGFLIYVRKRQAKKRTEQFQSVAEKLGFPFFPKGDSSLLERLDRFHLFALGRTKRIWNMLHGETDDIELAIFDYRYTTGRGKHQATYKQSVIYFRSPALNLPQFALRPEGMFHKIGAAFGYMDIDFETHPKFSKTCLLRGDDELKIRELFNDELITFFETQQKISVEGGNDQLIFYRQKKRIKPDAHEVQQFMEEGLQVFALFRGPGET